MGQREHQDALMATRETLADPDEPIHSPEVDVIDQGNGSTRITIPGHVCDMFDIEAGDELDLDAYRDRIVLSPKEE